ncbi:hypothetical protein GCM10010430_72830 [Kitasatospora cystarginea]|uniref:Uncharacterized protein n=1 Tax=Kitasatospora cystarginea TaxID=58350 RepID=A0ABN3EXI4_9ACTN
MGEVWRAVFVQVEGDVQGWLEPAHDLVGHATIACGDKVPRQALGDRPGLLLVEFGGDRAMVAPDNQQAPGLLERAENTNDSGGLRLQRRSFPYTRGWATSSPGAHPLMMPLANPACHPVGIPRCMAAKAGPRAGPGRVELREAGRPGPDGGLHPR